MLGLTVSGEPFSPERFFWLVRVHVVALCKAGAWICCLERWWHALLQPSGPAALGRNIGRKRWFAEARWRLFLMIDRLPRPWKRLTSLDKAVPYPISTPTTTLLLNLPAPRPPITHTHTHAYLPLTSLSSDAIHSGRPQSGHRRLSWPATAKLSLRLNKRP